MNWERLREILLKTELPCAYHHFETPQTPPFLAYGQEGESVLYADDRPYHKAVTAYIELYSGRKNPELERKITGLLVDHRIPHAFSYEEYIASERLHLVCWRIQMTGGNKDG